MKEGDREVPRSLFAFRNQDKTDIQTSNTDFLSQHKGRRIQLPDPHLVSKWSHSVDPLLALFLRMMQHFCVSENHLSATSAAAAAAAATLKVSGSRNLYSHVGEIPDFFPSLEL